MTYICWDQLYATRLHAEWNICCIKPIWLGRANPTNIHVFQKTEMRWSWASAQFKLNLSLGWNLVKYTSLSQDPLYIHAVVPRRHRKLWPDCPDSVFPNWEEQMLFSQCVFLVWMYCLFPSITAGTVVSLENYSKIFIRRDLSKSALAKFSGQELSAKSLLSN